MQASNMIDKDAQNTIAKGAVTILSSESTKKYYYKTKVLKLIGFTIFTVASLGLFLILYKKFKGKDLLSSLSLGNSQSGGSILTKAESAFNFDSIKSAVKPITIIKPNSLNIKNIKPPTLPKIKIKPPKLPKIKKQKWL